MPSTALRALPAIACLALPALPATAEVSPAEVWASWQASFGVDGEQITLRTGSVSEAGDALTVTDAELVFEPDMEGADGDARISVGLGDIVFTDQGDGTVAITLAEEMPISLTGVDEDGLPFDARFGVSLRGTEIVASGSAEALQHDARSDAIAVSLEEMRPMEEGTDLEISVILNGLVQRSLVEEGAVRRTTFSSAAESLAYALAARIEGDGAFSLDYESADYTVAGSVAIPEGRDGTESVGVLLADDAYGVRFTSATSGSAANLSFEDTAPGGDVDFAGAAGSVDLTIGAGEQTVSLAEGGLSVASRAEAITGAMISDQLPVPVAITLGSTSFTLASPLSPRETEGEMRFGLSLRDLSIDDFLWDLFDPAAVLPRDPATFVLDIAALGRWIVDPFNESALAAQEDDELPGEVSSARIEALELRAAGARVTAEGGVSFDYSDRETFDGLPAPDGEVSARIEGVGGLIDKLVMMGLVPQEQSMGARLMLGLFASPVAGEEDVFTSNLVVAPDGSVFANGQQIR
ncbi:MAG: DUF2125 domain-containing protein [Pseudomonadota bacterium]